MKGFLQELRDEPVSGAYQCLFFLFPLGAATVHHWATVFFYALIAVSLFVCFRNRFPFRGFGPSSILWGYSAFFLAVVLSLVNADDFSQGLSRIDPLLGFLLFFLILQGVRRSKAKVLTSFLKGMAVAGPMLFAVALYSTQVQGVARASGYYNAIVFGDFAVFVVLTGLSFFCFRNSLARGWQWMFFIAIPLALYASFLSGTRGSWVALLAAIPLFVYVHKRREQGRKGLVVLVLSLTFVVASPYLFPDTVGFHVKRTVHSVEAFLNGENKNTSTGQRFLMWSVAIDIWRENPILGTGLGDFRHDVRERMEEGDTELNVVHVHAHNIFYEYLATTGLIGFVSMIGGLFIIPFWFFVKSAYQNHSRQVIFCGFVGIVTLVAFAVFGLTENWLGRSVFVKSFLVSMLAYVSTITMEKHDA